MPNLVADSGDKFYYVYSNISEKNAIIIPRKFNKEVWQDLRPRRFWVRLARTSAWWDNDDGG